MRDLPSGPGPTLLRVPPGLGPLSHSSPSLAGAPGVCVCGRLAPARDLLSIPNPDPPGSLSPNSWATALSAPALTRSLTRERRRRRRQRRACRTVSAGRQAAGGERPSGPTAAEVAAADCAPRPPARGGPGGRGGRRASHS